MPPHNKWTFQVVPGVFLDFSTIQHSYPGDRVPTQPDFGLLPRAYPSDHHRDDKRKPWERLAAYVRSLNEDSPDGTAYKVLFLTRHGFGVHNKKHDEVGTEAWDNEWSLMDGDGRETWFDAFLTPQGIHQAQTLSALWRTAITHDSMPSPQSIYTSPLARCMQTTQHLFFTTPTPLTITTSSSSSSTTSYPQAVIKEGLRERYTLHTCDKRRPRAWIAATFPGWAAFEDGFAEEDPWRARTSAETDDEHVARKQQVLEELFDGDEGEFLALVVHSYAIRAIVVACQAELFRVKEGSTVVLLVKGERKS